MKDVFYLAAVCAVVPGLGRAKLPVLIARLGSAEAVFKASAEELESQGILKPSQISNFIANRRADLPERIESFCSRQNVTLLSIYDDDYPYSLKNISDPPLILYIKGTMPKDFCGIAIVGSRRATSYGLKAAGVFSGALSREGLTIISGGARGIDTAAHEACLYAGGKTIAVLGCGLDIVYPPENAELFKNICRQGAVISEYAPGTKPLPNNFPARNRIIVGLSSAVIVAEAARKSGAIITANIAADEGRDVYCVPGNIFDGTSIGCHDLIRNGAKLVDSPEDALEDAASWRNLLKHDIHQQDLFEMALIESDISKEEKRGEKPKQLKKALPDSVSPLGKKLWELLGQGALSLEELTEQSGTDFTAVSIELLDLQVAGLVGVNQAQRYHRS